jgi:cytochrome b561
MAHFDLINVARYLHRPLFAQIKSLLAVDGIILYHTFMQGSEVFGSPKNPNFLLKQGELAEVFADWHIWCDQTLVLADGRPMSYFIAQKPQPQNE